MATNKVNLSDEIMFNIFLNNCTVHYDAVISTEHNAEIKKIKEINKNKSVAVQFYLSIYSLVLPTIGHHWWPDNQLPPFQSVLWYSHCITLLQFCPLCDFIFPSFPQSSSSLPSLHSNLHECLSKPCWSWDMSLPFKSAHFHNRQ